MKHKPVIVALSCAFLSGCATNPIQKLDAQIPNGNWEYIEVGYAAKFTSASLKGSGEKRDGKWVSGELHGQYNGYWVTKATIDLKAK